MERDDKRAIISGGLTGSLVVIGAGIKLAFPDMIVPFEWAISFVGAGIAGLLATSVFALRSIVSQRSPMDPGRQISIPELLRYLGHRSAWAANREAMSDGEWVKAGCTEILGALSLGRLRATGVYRNDLTKVYDTARSFIPAIYWKDAKLDGASIYFSDMTWQHVGKATPGDYNVYGGVRLSADDVLRVWPRRSWIAAMLGHSPAERTGIISRWKARNKHLKTKNEFYWKPL